jgi:hypothetical protein
MPLDFRYSNQDRPLLDTGDYETTPGGFDAMCREMSCATVEGPDGIYGNRWWDEQDREFDNEETRRLILFYYSEVAERHEALGTVADVTLELGDPVGTGPGLALKVEAHDVMARRPETAILPTKGLI